MRIVFKVTNIVAVDRLKAMKFGRISELGWNGRSQSLGFSELTGPFHYLAFEVARVL